jgi:hypothetical protein
VYIVYHFKKNFINLLNSKKMRNLSSFKGVTLNTEELRQIEGGGNIPILRLTGVLDGIPHNTHLYFFKWRIF